MLKAVNGCYRVAIQKVTEESGARDQSSKLRQLWELSDRRHLLVGVKEKPDIIFMTDIAGPGWYSELRNNLHISAAPSRCFAISDSDYPKPLLHGIYTSAHKNLPFKSRYRTGAYNLYSDDQKNEFVEGFASCAADVPKRFLYSFQGRDSSNIRKQLFSHPPVPGSLIENTTSTYSGFGNQLANHRDNQSRYFEVMRDSKFVLCPGGVGAASIRLFEAMKIGVAPVILSDNWILPEGPDWNACSIQIKESEASNIQRILESLEHLSPDFGRKAQKVYYKYFSDESYFNFLVDSAISIQRHQIIPEKLFWIFRNHMVKLWKYTQRFSGRPKIGLHSQFQKT